jgi:hypothetical protein
MDLMNYLEKLVIIIFTKINIFTLSPSLYEYNISNSIFSKDKLTIQTMNSFMQYPMD